MSGKKKVTILFVSNYAIHKLCFFFLFVSFLTIADFLFYRALFPFQKSDSSLSDFLSDEDINPSKETGKIKTVKKTDSANPQKDSSAFDQDQKVTEIKLR